MSSFRVVGTRGDLRVDPAFSLKDDIRHFLTVGGKTEERAFKKRDQVAPEIVYFSECIQKDREPEPDGVEGLTDVRIIEALQQSYREGRPVKLEPFEAKPRPTLAQSIERPPHGKEELVEAAPPSGR